MIIVNASKCLMCGDTIFSRYRHDFKTCYCGNLSIDGGPFYRDDSGMVGGEKYNRTSVYITNMVEVDDLILDLTEININNIGKILYDDWNQNKNEYGYKRDPNYTDEQRYAARAKINLLK